MQNDEAIKILARHLMQCGALMPIDWVQKNGEGSEFMQAYEMAMDALTEKGETMYKSPIEIIYAQTQTQIEGDILKAIQSYGIAVDKNELIQALQYDRDQYAKGYSDGKRDAMNEVVRCKECRYYDEDGEYCGFWGGCRHPEHFCGEGEMREGE